MRAATYFTPSAAIAKWRGSRRAGRKQIGRIGREVGIGVIG